MFKGITLEEFNRFFSSETKCKQYLFDLKWKKGFCCKRCGYDKKWNGRTCFHSRCARCNYDESITAHTIFHKLQIPLLKAFSIAFHISVLKKGISSNDLSKIYGINQKTGWAFKKKVQQSMGTALCSNLGSGKGNFFKLDSIAITRRPGYLNGLQRVDLMIRKKRSQVDKLILYNCKGCISNPNEVDPCQLIAGRYKDEGKNIQLWNFKVWLTGIHHHCSEKYLQGYLDEFYFKYNCRKKANTIFHVLIRQMIRTKPSSFNSRAA